MVALWPLLREIYGILVSGELRKSDCVFVLWAGDGSDGGGGGRGRVVGKEGSEYPQYSLP